MQCSFIERPDKLNVSSRNITATSVVIEWSKNFNGNKNISGFNLTYFLSGNKQDSNIKTLPPNITSFIVMSLKPYSNYTFEITARNEIGVSDPASVSLRTSEDSKFLFEYNCHIQGVSNKCNFYVYIYI